MANVRPNHMGNYPDDVWPGDPKAPWNESDLETTCAECLSFHAFSVADGRTMISAVKEPWRRTEGAIKAIDATIRGCGFCLARHDVVGADDIATYCEDWEEV